MNKLIICLLLTLWAAVPAWAEVAVIVHPSNTSSFSNDDIQKLFLGKKSSFPGGGKATPYYLPSGDATREAFDEKALGKSSSQLKAYWSKLVFTGKGTPPDEVGGASQAIAKVAAEASAIAYVDASAVTDSVKVVARFP